MAWTKETALTKIREVGLVPIVRAPSPEDAMRAAEAIVAGGIGIAEITMTVPGALRQSPNAMAKRSCWVRERFSTRKPAAPHCWRARSSS
jgi:2-keto-3-deoxy-6-phosphogluconate aldolase